MLGSNLQDILYIWLDTSAEPVAVNLVTRGACSLEKPTTSMITTEVQVKYPDGGPIPDTATYIQKLEREKQAREAGEVKDNRSFFAKYVRLKKKKYIYIFEFLLLLMNALTLIIFLVDVHSASINFFCLDICYKSRSWWCWWSSSTSVITSYLYPV